MNWSRLVEALLIPALLAAPAAWWLWSRYQVMLGTVVVMGALLLSSFFFAAVEFVDCDRIRLACFNEGLKSACLAVATGPSDFVKVGAYGAVAFFQVMVLFIVSEIVESRRRDRLVDPAWRR